MVGWVVAAVGGGRSATFGSTGVGAVGAAVGVSACVGMGGRGESGG